MSGADSGYGFFAPSVGSQTRAVFTLSDGAGRTWTDTFDEGGNHEVQLRLGSMVSNTSYEGLRRGLAASWSGKLFARHPDAHEVRVRIELYDLPPMDEYRDGARPEWRTVYEATFLRDEPLAEQER
jgi:hypothetical protein